MGQPTRVPVPEQSKARSYYKYYSKEFAAVPKEKLDFLKAPYRKMEDGLDINDRNKLFEPGYLPDEQGIFPTAQGGAVVANRTFFPGSNGEMLQWWFGWHGVDPLRYAIWDPYDHYDLEISFADRAKILDPATPIPQKCYDVLHVVTESLVMGDAPVPLYLWFSDPAKLGYDASKIFTEACSFMVCANVEIKTPMGHLPVVMTHMARDIEGGCELRTRFWMGYNIINGQAQYLMPGGASFPQKVCEELLSHNFNEFTNLSVLLPQVYAEEKDNWE